jgi:hypothetical protein
MSYITVGKVTLAMSISITKILDQVNSSLLDFLKQGR